jgi:hypothetical protein
MRVWRWGRASSGKTKKTFGLFIRSCLRRRDISFYQRLNELLEAEKFDEFVERRCAKFYAVVTENSVRAGNAKILSACLHSLPEKLIEGTIQ